MIGEVRFIYNTYTTLSSILVRNIFPDPDIFCSTMELTHNDGFEWILWLFNVCLSDTISDQYALKLSKTREDLIHSLRRITDMVDFSTKIDSRYDAEIDILARIIPNWPNFNFGGARILQIVRGEFVFQYKTLKELDFKRHVSIGPNLQPHSQWSRS